MHSRRHDTSRTNERVPDRRLLLLRRGLEAAEPNSAMWELEMFPNNETAFGETFFDLIKRGTDRSLELHEELGEAKKANPGKSRERCNRSSSVR